LTLLAEIVADGACDSHVVYLVAVHASFHFHDQKRLVRVLAMARGAPGFMFGMAEENKVRQHINRLCGPYWGIFGHIEPGVANLAFLGFRKPCPLRSFGRRVARDALQFQGRVAGVVELNWCGEG
jgi:hypothetical protein